MTHDSQYLGFVPALMHTQQAAAVAAREARYDGDCSSLFEPRPSPYFRFRFWLGFQFQFRFRIWFRF